MKVKGLVIANKEVYQEIDLEEITGIDFTGNEPLKLSIGQATIDYMRDRTSKSKDIYGSNLSPYSKSYKKSDAYEAYNKSSKVNMKLTGDMLLSMGFEVQGNTLRFGFEDKDDELKAYGHMSGMEGHKFLDGKTPTRLFFGITQDDFESKILSKFDDDLKFLRSQNNQERQEQEQNDNINLNNFIQDDTTLNNSLDNFLRGLFDDEEF